VPLQDPVDGYEVPSDLAASRTQSLLGWELELCWYVLYYRL